MILLSKLHLASIFSLTSAFDLPTVENRINHLSNQRLVNSDLLQDDDQRHIGWLQSTSVFRREETVRLLFENKNYLTFIKEVRTIENLQTLNALRLKIEAPSEGYRKQEDCLKLISEIKGKNTKLTLGQFEASIDRWIEVFDKESELEERKGRLKDIINPKGGKKR